MKFVIIVGAATPPGRLNAAMSHVAQSLPVLKPGTMVDVINLAEAQVDICDGRKLEEYGAPTQKAVATVVDADAVLIASPVYRASYPGVLKNLLDQLPVEALCNKPVGIVSMGGSPHHYLAVDSHLRLVLAWFGALAMPTAVYLTGKDFADGKLASETAEKDLRALAEGLVETATAFKGRNLGPTPLAARY
jgi:FMN reductase